MTRMRGASRLLTAAVWGSGALLGAILVQRVTGWGGDCWARAVNELVGVPVTVLTAVLGLRLILRSGLDPKERRA